MGAIGNVVRVQQRSGRRRFVALSVLIGLAAGLALGGAAGARRTDTSFSRMLQRYPGPDVIIPNIPDSTGGTAVFDAATVQSIPGVAIVGEAKPLVSLIDGRPIVNVAHVDAELGNGGVLPYKIVEGRPPDPARLDEAIANYAAADRMNLRVGDVVPLELVPPFKEFLTRPDVDLPKTVRIVGAYVGPSEIFSEEQSLPLLHFSPAVARLIPPFVSSALLVSLHDGPAGVPAFLGELENRAQGKRVQVNQAHNADRDKQSAISTEAAAVWFLAGLLAITALLIVAQALIRHATAAADEDRVLAILGMTRRQLWMKSMLRALLVLVAGAVGAVGVMYLVSPLFPWGVARLAEPHPGFAFDASVAWIGASSVVVAVLAAIAWPLHGLSGAALLPPGQAIVRGPDQSPSLFRRRVSSHGPLSLGLGASLAFDGRKGPTSKLATVGSMAAAIAGLIAALVFATSLAHLLDSPRLYGLTWDAALASATVDTRGAAEPLRDDVRIDGLAFGVTGVAFRLAGQAVDAELIDPPIKGPNGVVVLEGRAPASADEIALGTRTMRDLRLHVGDVVDGSLSGTPPAPMRVVGRIVVQPVNSGPHTSFVTSTALSLGDGALATYSGVANRAPGSVPPAQAFIRFAAGVDHSTAVPALLQTIGGDAATTTFAAPLDVIAFGQVRNLPLIFAGLLGAIAFLTLLHMLLADTRRRHRELAIFKALGLMRRDIVSVVVWQASLLAAVALALGGLAGTVGGRWLWIALVRGPGIVAESRTSPLALVGVTAAVMLGASLVALCPGLMAARVRPSVVLSTE